MQTLYTETAEPVIDGAMLVREASFGSVYEGEVVHANGRKNTYVETVPYDRAFPDSVVVIGGGFTSSKEHYALVQRQLAMSGERSVFVDHSRHSGYEIGHNAQDIAATCEAISFGGIRRVVLLGHSRGAPEVLEAHELLREQHIPLEVSDIVLAFPAQFIASFPKELFRSLPKFAIELAVGAVRQPKRQLLFLGQVMLNVMGDVERTVKEGLHLLTHQAGTDLVDRIGAHQNRPRLHFVLGLHDGLIPGQAVLKSLEDSQHDSVTVLRSGHIDLNTLPVITDIIHTKVREVREEHTA